MCLGPRSFLDGERPSETIAAANFLMWMVFLSPMGNKRCSQLPIMPHLYGSKFSTVSVCGASHLEGDGYLPCMRQLASSFIF